MKWQAMLVKYFTMCARIQKLLTLFALLQITLLATQAPANGAEHGAVPAINAEDPDQACFSCHNQIWRTGMWPDGTLHSIYIDPVKYAESKHKRMGRHCTDCHGQYARCRHLSSERIPEYLQETKDRCLGCHEKKTECLECHRPRTGWEPVHAYAVSKSAHSKISCKGCHGFTPNIHYEFELRPAAATGRESCGRCHEKEQKAYLNSIHGKILKERPGHAPECVDCHGSHYIQPLKKKTGELVSSRTNPFVCGECHREEFETYIENYHGRVVTNFNSSKAPTCYDCHGDHEITSLRNEKEALAACRKCHKDAPEKMAGYAIHAEENNVKREPLLYTVKTAMTLLLVGTLSTFYLHSYMWFYRKRKEKVDGSIFEDE